MLKWRCEVISRRPVDVEHDKGRPIDHVQQFSVHREASERRLLQPANCSRLIRNDGLTAGKVSHFLFVLLRRRRPRASQRRNAAAAAIPSNRRPQSLSPATGTRTPATMGRFRRVIRPFASPATPVQLLTDVVRRAIRACACAPRRLRVLSTCA